MWIKVAVLLAILITWTLPVRAATVNATTCSEADVQTAIGTANVDDTVAVPAGSCTWTSLNVNKAVSIVGNGIGSTNITLGASNTITKQAAGSIWLRGFSFSKSGGGNSSKGFTIDGAWTGTEPVIIEGNAFDISGSGLFRLEAIGGIVISGNTFTGALDDSFIQPKATGGAASWTAASTMGTLDTDGDLNTYVEDNSFYGGGNQGIDCDENSRVVYRWNSLEYSSFNSHGRATGPHSCRQWEIYNTEFLYTDSGCAAAECAMNWSVLIRGGSGVIFNNYFDDISGSYWGGKIEVHLYQRVDTMTYVGGSCPSYPWPEQLGQSHDGVTSITDPARIHGNTGTVAVTASVDNWGNPCGFATTDLLLAGRDYTTDGTEWTIANGNSFDYAVYTYPHPLRTIGHQGNGYGTPPVGGSPTPHPTSRHNHNPSGNFWQ